MRSVARPAAAGTTAPTRIVCLSGAFQVAEDFIAAGFDARVRERALPIDLCFVDPELQHLGDRRFREQLKHDILAPARALGCERLWLAGISLGGFMALDYAASHPGELDGLCVLAPYLGNRMLTGEIGRAPALDAWVPGDLAESDEERRIWGFIQAQGAGSRPVYLGYGREDRFAPAHRLMAQALPSSAVDVVPGGHDWRTWTILWENFLDSTFT
ncbi:MAG: alpha/beta hydrolase-fold protein [Steroidobacteraceae bacterium]